MKVASRVVNATLGEPCLYERVSDGHTLVDVNVTIDKNKPVYDEFNMLQGFGVEISVLKEDFEQIPEQYDTFTTAEGEVFTVLQRTEETSAKWYFSVT